MSNNGEGLLAAWRENPDDRDVRLVYADWLEEATGDILRSGWLRDPELGPFTSAEDHNPTAGLILALIGEDEAKAEKAEKLLVRLGEDAIAGLLRTFAEKRTRYHQGNFDWQRRKKIRKVLDSIAGEEAISLAYLALYGDLDNYNGQTDTQIRVDALRKLGKLGPRAAAIAIEFNNLLHGSNITESMGQLDEIETTLLEIIPEFGHLAGPAFLATAYELYPEKYSHICEPLIDLAKSLYPDPDALEALLRLYEYWQGRNWDVCDDAFDALVSLGLEAAPKILDRLAGWNDYRGFDLGRSMGTDLIPFLANAWRTGDGYPDSVSAACAALYGVATSHPETAEDALLLMSELISQAKPDEKIRAFDGVFIEMGCDPEQEAKMVPVALDLLQQDKILPMLALMIFQIPDNPVPEIMQIAQQYLKSGDEYAREVAKNFFEQLERRAEQQSE